MSLSFNFINLFILFGAFQGLLIGLFLFFSKKHTQPNQYFLGAFMLILAYNGLETFNWSAKWNHPFFYNFSYILIFGLAPSLYFYIKSFGETVSFSHSYKHYLPVLLQFLIRLGLAIGLLYYPHNDPSYRVFFQLQLWHEDLSEPLSILLALYYFWMSWKAYRNMSQIPENEAIILAETKPWLKTFMIAMLFFGAMWVLSYIGNFFIRVSNFSLYYPTEVLLVILMYWIGFTGYHRTKIITQSPEKQPLALNDFSITEIEHYAQLLSETMKTEKLYLNPELTVGQVANHLGLNQKLVSAVLNQHLKKGFNEFVNEYRVEEVKKRLALPQYQHLTIAGIALESGFNSQATFQRTFKKIAQLSPTEYMAATYQNSLK